MSLLCPEPRLKGAQTKSLRLASRVATGLIAFAVVLLTDDPRGMHVARTAGHGWICHGVKMKLGYSMLWGEFLQAADLDYSLMAELQVVCPNCRESIFKVERRLADGGLTHYLAHRPAGDDAELAETQRRCELRVAAMTRAEMDSATSGSRGQTLEAFLDDLRGRVAVYIRVLGIDGDHPAFLAEAGSLAEDPRVHGLANTVRAKIGRERRAEIEKHLLDPDKTREHFERTPALAKLGISRGLFADGSRFGDDILTHLETAQAAPNWRFLVAAVILRDRTELRKHLNVAVGASVADAVAASTVDLGAESLSGFLTNLGRAWLEPVSRGRGPLQVKAERKALVRLMHRKARQGNPDLGPGDARAAEELIQRRACEWIYKNVVNIVSMLPFTAVIRRHLDGDGHCDAMS